MVNVVTISTVVHFLFAALWTGSVVFVAVGVLPTARRDGVGAAALRGTVGRLRMVSRISALVLLLTGGQLAGERYTVETLLNTQDGLSVIAMIVLWVALAGFIEIGGAQIEKSGEAASGRRILQLAAIVAVGLLLLSSLFII